MTIKMKELYKIVKDYHTDFPDWTIMNKDSLVRVNGPVLQGILFNRSSEDDYRPVGFIRVLTAPEVIGAMELAQYLCYPNGAPDRRVRLNNHEKEREDIVKELHRQIVPPLGEPLDALEVLKLYEKKAAPTTPEAYSLATLNAYLGFERKARRWCDRYRKLSIRWKDYLTKYDYERAEFLDSLEKWMDEGVVKQQLYLVIEEELHRLGLSKGQSEQAR